MSPIQLKITTLIVHFNFKTAMSVHFDYSDGSRISREGFNLKYWFIQDFPGGEGAPTPKVGVLTYFFGRKLHENERICTPGGGVGRAASPAHPLGPANPEGGDEVYYFGHLFPPPKLHII